MNKAGWVALMGFAVLAAPLTAKADTTLYTCNALIDGNLGGKAIFTAGAGSVLTLISENNPTISSQNVIEANVQLQDTDGNLISLAEENAFWGAVDPSPSVQKGGVGVLTGDPASSFEIKVVDVFGNDDALFHRVKHDLQFTSTPSQSGATFTVSYTEDLRTCPHDFFGLCDFGTFVQQLAVQMSCTAI